MASPGQGFRAHDCQDFLLTDLDYLGQALLELRRRHKVGESTKTGISPAKIGRRWQRLPEAAPSRERACIVSTSGAGLNQEILD